MSRILRFVRFTAAPGALPELRHVVLGDVVPVNTRFGCVSCWVLEERERPGVFAIVSVWDREEDLSTMRAAPEYAALVSAIRERTTEGLHETLFGVVA